MHGCEYLILGECFTWLLAWNPFFLQRFVGITSIAFSLDLCKASRKECASYMVGLPVPFRYEYLMAETIFSQVNCSTIVLFLAKLCWPSLNFCSYKTTLTFFWSTHFAHVKYTHQTLFSSHFLVLLSWNLGTVVLVNFFRLYLK